MADVFIYLILLGRQVVPTEEYFLESGSVTTNGGGAAVQFAQENKGRFVEELKALLRIPSVSTDPERVGDVRRAAEFVAAELKRIGMENVRLIETTTPEEGIVDAAGGRAGWGGGRGIRWFTRIGCRRGARRLRCFVMGITMCSRPSRWMSGSRRRLSRRSGMATFMPVGRWMTRDRCGCR